jgi:hypothetical protein
MAATTPNTTGEGRLQQSPRVFKLRRVPCRVPLINLRVIMRTHSPDQLLKVKITLIELTAIVRILHQNSAIIATRTQRQVLGQLDSVDERESS